MINSFIEKDLNFIIKIFSSTRNSTLREFFFNLKFLSLKKKNFINKQRLYLSENFFGHTRVMSACFEIESY